MDCEFKDKASLSKFIHAGLAIFTILNEETGNRYTYKVEKSNKEPNKFFVSLLTGPDNLHDYTYIGMIADNKFFATKGTKIKKDSTPWLVADWLLNKALNSGRIFPPIIHVYHISRCGRCGRPLTTPKSVQTGYGSECASIMGYN